MSQKPPAGREDPDREGEELAISHARAYTAPGVTVFYDRGRCLHFAECVRGLPQVFDVAKRPWIQPQNASADEVAEVVRRCPSGALHYRLEEGPPEQPEQPTRVEFVSNGPINLRGDLSIEVSAGRMREVRASLCRCGRTENEPFCDNACSRTGWTSEPRARDQEKLREMTEFVALGRAKDLEEGGMRAFDVKGTTIAVAKVGGAFHAFDDTCTHRQCSLAEGDLHESTVICPCHGSEFDVESGEVLRGPASEPVETYDVRLEDGNLEIKG
jgi:nitrite reductase/ring-hydroxylating ferredoxin subunit/uncharacterized Fe-S cluster protein YjdI/CDGSH-type Zn-finger protein